MLFLTLKCEQTMNIRIVMPLHVSCCDVIKTDWYKGKKKSSRLFVKPTRINVWFNHYEVPHILIEILSYQKACANYNQLMVLSKLEHDHKFSTNFLDISTVYFLLVAQLSQDPIYLHFINKIIAHGFSRESNIILSRNFILYSTANVVFLNIAVRL